MFTPPRCPNPRCTQHARPTGRWWRKRGSYHPSCRPQPVPRFDCKSCSVGFSRQTFRADYWDKKPALNAPLARLLSSGTGLRQSARVLGLHPNSTMAKARKLGHHLLQVQRNFVRSLRMAEPTLVLDEMETFEGSRRTRPLTLPVLVEKESMFLVGADADTLPARGRLPPRFRRIQRKEEERFGRRRNRSPRVVARILGIAARSSRGRTRLLCDKKSTYSRLARRAFRGRPLSIEQTSSRAPRTSSNPLFPINLTNAMLRDLLGRLRRRSWLVSKKRRELRIALAFVVCYRNYVRPRFNRDAKKRVRTPAQMLGLCPTPLRFEQLLSWRQNWGPRSPCLLGR